MNKKNRLITKLDGTCQPFDPDKYIQSLIKAGVAPQEAQQLAEIVMKNPEVCQSTKRLKQKTHALLRRYNPSTAGRYKLKDALMKLGPTGYPFEQIVGQIFQVQQYKVLMNQQVKGQCVDHEIDVIAEKSSDVWLVECKYHNQQNTRSDVKVPLYIKSRFDDIRHTFASKNVRYCIACNTRFTDDAITYAKCAGIQLLSWNYPLSNSLNLLLDKYKIYPVSVLHHLNRQELDRLYENSIYTVRDLVDRSNELIGIFDQNTKLKEILEEVQELI